MYGFFFLLSIALLLVGIVHLVGFCIRVSSRNKHVQYKQKLYKYAYIVSIYFAIGFIYVSIVPEPQRFSAVPIGLILFYLYIVPIPIAMYYWSIVDYHNKQIKTIEKDLTNPE